MRGSSRIALIMALTLLPPVAALAGPAGKWRVGDGKALFRAGLEGAVAQDLKIGQAQAEEGQRDEGEAGGDG